MIHIDIEITSGISTTDVMVRINEEESTVGNPVELLAARNIMEVLNNWLQERGDPQEVRKITFRELQEKIEGSANYDQN
jgi:hypothetical protein